MRASAPVSRSVELGYAEIASAFTVTRAGADLTNDITNLVVPNVVVGSRPIKVILDGSFMQIGAAGMGARALIIQGAATEVARTQLFSPAGGPVNPAVPVHRERRLSLAPGTYSFKGQLAALFVNGNAVLDATAASPLSLQVVEL
jgi:hypothetical protein